MRLLLDYLIPLVVIALGYIGIQRVMTRANWSFLLRFIFHSFAAALLAGMIMYEYFSERPIIDTLREAAGNAVCRHFVMERCPDWIRIEAADAEATRIHREISKLVKQNRFLEADQLEKNAREADQRSQDLRQEAHERQRLLMATTMMKDKLGAGAKIGTSSVVGSFAIVSWTQNPMGGEALLKFDAPKGQWVLLELGGGAWSVESLVKNFDVSKETARALLAKISISGMDREPPEMPVNLQPVVTTPVDEEALRVTPSRISAAAAAKSAGFLGVWSINCKLAPGPHDESSLAFFIDARGDAYVATYQDLGHAPPNVFALQEAVVKTDELRITRTEVSRSWRGWWTYREIFRYSENAMQLIERTETFSDHKGEKPLKIVGGRYTQDYVIPKLRGQPTPTHTRCVNDVPNAVRAHLEREYSFNNTMLARSPYTAMKPGSLDRPGSESDRIHQTAINTGNTYHYVANTLPPDAFLSLRSEPTTRAGHRIMAMSNGTLLQVILQRDDGWWLVRVVQSGKEGWALSGQSDRRWIECCRPLQGVANDRR
jgi:hypothetical protein